MKLSRRAFYICFLLALWLIVAFSAGALAADPQREIEDKLIAPCCWSQPVSQHDSEASRKIKREVAEMLAAGKSQDQIIEHFVSEYEKISRSDVHRRLEFYKVVGLLGVAIVVSSWISKPLDAYRCFGRKAFERALAYPFLQSHSLAKKWLNEDFLVSYLQYCQDFIETTLKR